MMRHCLQFEPYQLYEIRYGLGCQFPDDGKYPDPAHSRIAKGLSPAFVMA
ncbi:hypothetical protein FACS1894129_1450 [Actinomycetota bacterium]|nr:hypothetical protein FACS1894129_1450 [Actinomycetota bacterium]